MQGDQTKHNQSRAKNRALNRFIRLIYRVTNTPLVTNESGKLAQKSSFNESGFIDYNQIRSNRYAGIHYYGHASPC